jgi:type I restriction enzyme S subunit
MMTSRATIGVVAISRVEACTNQGFITCIPSGTVGAHQLYFWLLENRPKIISLATGATFKEINKATFRQLPITVAPDTIRAAFENAATPITDLVANLVQKNTNLRTTRDLLLPKLISGEIPVEAAAELMEQTA